MLLKKGRSMQHQSSKADKFRSDEAGLGGSKLRLEMDMVAVAVRPERKREAVKVYGDDSPRGSDFVGDGVAGNYVAVETLKKRTAEAVGFVVDRSGTQPDRSHCVCAGKLENGIQVSSIGAVSNLPLSAIDFNVVKPAIEQNKVGCRKRLTEVSQAIAGIAAVGLSAAVKVSRCGVFAFAVIMEDAFGQPFQFRSVIDGNAVAEDE